jgi:hypothetical protein
MNNVLIDQPTLAMLDGGYAAVASVDEILRAIGG